MSTPTILEPTGTATDGTNQKWGGPNAKHAAQLLKGTHASEKIQVSAIASGASTNTAQTFTSKTMDALSNTLPRIQQAPEKKYLGGILLLGGATAASWGMIPVPTLSGTSATTSSEADGVFKRLTTTGVANNQSGYRINNLTFTRSQNPRLRFRFRLGATNTNLRLFLGFTSSGANPATTDDPLTALSGFTIALRAADTTFQIAHNDGTGATVFNETSIAKDAAEHTVDLYADNANTRFQWQIDGGTVTNVTTEIPAADNAMGCLGFLGNYRDSHKNL